MTAHRAPHRRGAAASGAVGMGMLGMVLAADQASAAYCETGWGSLAKSVTAYSTRPVEGVRAGQHPRYDRLVVDVGAYGSHDVGYDVRYVDEVSRPDGSPLPLRGDAILQLTVRSPAHDLAGRPTYLPRDDSDLVPVTGYRTFDQTAWVGSSETETTLGLGVRARLPMRAFLLPVVDGGRRVVVDVAHHW